jgi:hypothetical protein
MTQPSAQWLQVFPGPRIPNVLSYMHDTWEWLLENHGASVAFPHNETVLTDNLCQALEDDERRRKNNMDCDFQAETWELRRDAAGQVTRIARADIRVILGAPGTPHLVIEFKKLDGTANGRWRYCFDGLNRFVEGKYAVGHAYGVMCGFCSHDLDVEAQGIADYIAQDDYTKKLACVANGDGVVVTKPSVGDPTSARFDTTHGRPKPAANIVILHTLLPCPHTSEQ